MGNFVGNMITIKEPLARYSAASILIFVLQSHYRSPLTYSEEALGAAARGVERLRQAADERQTEQHEEVDTGAIKWIFISPGDLKGKFIGAMDDDFGTPRALSWLFAIASEINQAVSKGLDSEVVEHRKLLKELANILGLTFKPPQRPLLDTKLFAQISASVYKELSRTDALDEKQGAEKLI